jgi:hypothetical protein
VGAAEWKRDVFVHVTAYSLLCATSLGYALSNLMGYMRLEMHKTLTGVFVEYSEQQVRLPAFASPQ